MPERSVNKGNLRFRAGETTTQKRAIALKPPTHLDAMGGVINEIAGQLRRDAKQIIQDAIHLPHRVSERAKRLTGGATILHISNEEAARRAEEIKRQKEEQNRQAAERAETIRKQKEEQRKQVDERAKEIKKQHDERKGKKGQ